MRAHLITGLGLIAVIGGCSTVRDTMRTVPTAVERPATDGPGQFTLQDGTLNGNAVCQTPLVDPRDKTTIQLVRSDRGQGDYNVPAGKYGVGAGELLRVDCTTGRALGIIKAR